MAHARPPPAPAVGHGGWRGCLNLADFLDQPVPAGPSTERGGAVSSQPRSTGTNERTGADGGQRADTGSTATAPANTATASATTTPNLAARLAALLRHSSEGTLGPAADGWYESAALVGPPGCGKTSLLWQYALNTARKGHNVLFVARRGRAVDRPPLVFSSAAGAARLRGAMCGAVADAFPQTSNGTTGAGVGNFSGREGDGDSWQTVLRRIRVRYLDSAVELRRYFGFAHMHSGPAPELVIVDDFDSYFVTTGVSAASGSGVAGAADPEITAAGEAASSGSNSLGGVVRAVTDEDALRSSALVAEAARFWTFKRGQGTSGLQSLVPLPPPALSAKGAVAATVLLVASDTATLALLPGLAAALSFVMDAWLRLRVVGAGAKPTRAPAAAGKAPWQPPTLPTAALRRLTPTPRQPTSSVLHRVALSVEVPRASSWANASEGGGGSSGGGAQFVMDILSSGQTREAAAAGEAAAPGDD